MITRTGPGFSDEKEPQRLAGLCKSWDFWGEDCTQKWTHQAAVPLPCPLPIAAGYMTHDVSDQWYPVVFHLGRHYPITMGAPLRESHPPLLLLMTLTFSDALKFQTGTTISSPWFPPSASHNPSTPCQLLQLLLEFIPGLLLSPSTWVHSAPWPWNFSNLSQEQLFSSNWSAGKP